MTAPGKKVNGNLIIGDPQNFSLEERIFNTFCVIAFLSMLIEIPFNFIIGLPIPGILCVVTLLFCSYIYYLSRFKRKSTISITLFCAFCNIAFGVCYFFNSGINGPCLLLFSLAFLLIIAVVPKKHFKIWIPLHIIFVLSVIATEYLYPNLVPLSYTDKTTRFLDLGVSYVVTVILIYYSIAYIRKNYDSERAIVIENGLAIEEKNERILNQKLELEELNTKKNKLFSLVTHDIKAPLNSIQSYLELLTEMDLEEEERKVLKYQLLEITKETSNMLNNVLSWSKTQMNGTTAVLQPINLTDVLVNALLIEKTIALKKGVTLIIECADDINILADHNMFQLVIRNLVNNGIKFTPKDGSVIIKAIKKNDKCLLMVKDTGLGINQDQQKLLFKLNALSTFGTNNERGIGLGLTLCKEFTDLQGGEIWLGSSSNLGSTFYLSFNLVNE